MNKKLILIFLVFSFILFLSFVKNVDAATGNIQVTTTPSSAWVYLDGTYKGLSPILLTNVLTGSHNIMIRKVGYNSTSQYLIVFENQTEIINLTLIPANIGDIIVKTNPTGANVYLDNIFQGVTPINGNWFFILSVTPGSHTIKVTKTGYQDGVETRNILADNINDFQFNLTQINFTSCDGVNITIQPGSEGKDTFTSTYYPNTNVGNAIDLRAKLGIIGTPQIFEDSFIQFDLSFIPVNATIKCATLQLYKYFYGGSGVRTVNVYRINSGWDEQTITANNEPSYDTTTLDTQQVDIGSAGWVSWDIKNTIVSWINGGYVNYGLKLDSTTPVDRFTYTTRFYSSDFGNATLRPKLVVNYIN